MEPGSIRFGGGTADTLLHPLVAIAMVLAIILIIGLPRKYVIVPLLLAFFTIPKDQVIVLAGVHFPAFRILILVGLARWARFRRSALAGGFNQIDRLFTLFAVSYLSIFSLQWMQSQAFIKSCGDNVDVVGGYFLLRFLIRNREDVLRTIKVLAFAATINAICMLNEQRTGTNIFGLLGGPQLHSVVRDGKIRSQGAFEIFITAGAFGSTLPPLFVWLWSNTKFRIVAALGLAGATVMAITCHASTTLLAEAAGILGLCFWPLRKKMRFVRWGLVFIVVALHLVMHGPVWSLLEKIDLTGSSSSYHRYMLVDNCIRHFGDWWLLGCRNYGTWGWEMWDLSDQYVAYCLTGGLLTFILFVAMISRSFAALGKARKLVEPKRSEEWFLWCLGAALFSHVIAFIGIGYFDQVQFSWYALLAMISAAAAVTVQSGAPSPVASKIVEADPVFSPEAVNVQSFSL